MRQSCQGEGSFGWALGQGHTEIWAVWRRQPIQGQGGALQWKQRLHVKIPRYKWTCVRDQHKGQHEHGKWAAGRCHVTQCFMGYGTELLSVNWEVSIGSFAGGVHEYLRSADNIQRVHKLRREKFTSIFFLNSIWNVFPSVRNVGDKL